MAKGPQPGDPAPDFELETDEGGTVRLSDLRGKPVVLYFYPRDDTPGCTAQASAIRDAWSRENDPSEVHFGKGRKETEHRAAAANFDVVAVSAQT